MKAKLFLCALLLVFFVQTAWAQIPKTISYQGNLSDAGGTPVNGTLDLTFILYESETEGTAVWLETQSVLVTDGMFNVILGDDNSLDIPFDKQYWLGITVAGEELTPRSKLTSVPYSLNIPDGIVTSSKIDNLAVTLEKINTSGAVFGQSLIFDGTNLAWITPPGGGFTLPFSGAYSGTEHAFTLTHNGTGDDPGNAIYGINSGDGIAGQFEINNADNKNNAIFALTNGSGTVINGINFGTGGAGYFGIDNAGNSERALHAYTNGTGAAGLFEINNVSNSDHALLATTTGTGSAGYFENYNINNTSPALYAKSAGGIAGKFEGKLTATDTIESTSGGFKFPDGSLQITAFSGAGDGHSLDAADGSPTDAVYVDNDGKVGIGTLSPSEKLEVDGNILVNGALKYVTPRTHYYSLSPTDFSPSLIGGVDGFYCSRHSARMSSGYNSIYAPVHLPHGAVITEFTAFFWDASSDNLELTLSRGNWTDWDYHFCMAMVSSSGSSEDIRNTSMSPVAEPTINNADYRYSIKVNPAWNSSESAYGSWAYNLMVIGARITYTLGEAK